MEQFGHKHQAVACITKSSGTAGEGDGPAFCHFSVEMENWTLHNVYARLWLIGTAFVGICRAHNGKRDQLRSQWETLPRLALG